MKRKRTKRRGTKTGNNPPAGRILGYVLAGVGLYLVYRKWKGLGEPNTQLDAEVAEATRDIIAWGGKGDYLNNLLKQRYSPEAIKAAFSNYRASNNPTPQTQVITPTQNDTPAVEAVALQQSINSPSPANAPIDYLKAQNAVENAARAAFPAESLNDIIERAKLRGRYGINPEDSLDMVAMKVANVRAISGGREYDPVTKNIGPIPAPSLSTPSEEFLSRPYAGRDIRVGPTGISPVTGSTSSATEFPILNPGYTGDEIDQMKAFAKAIKPISEPEHLVPEPVIPLQALAVPLFPSVQEGYIQPSLPLDLSKRRRISATTRVRGYLQARDGGGYRKSEEIWVCGS